MEDALTLQRFKAIANSQERRHDWSKYLFRLLPNSVALNYMAELDSIMPVNIDVFGEKEALSIRRHSTIRMIL